MKKQKQPVDRDLVDRSFFARVEPFLYLLPFLIGIAVFTLYPVINVVLMSFKEGYSYLSRGFDQWGLANYQTVLSDPKFSQAIGNTLKYVILVVPISTCIAVVVAYLLNQKLRFSAVFQTAYFLPMVTSVTAVGLVWKWMFNYDYGLINYALSLFGVSPVNWLNDPHYNLAALIIYGIWSMLPFTIILLLSGFQNINPQYYTAARIDGANELQIFTRIMFPLGSSVTVTLTIFSFMWRWNDYILPLLVLSDQKKYTIQIAIKNFIGNLGVDWSSILAASVLSILPVIVIFIFLQKYIIGGISASGVKG